MFSLIIAASIYATCLACFFFSTFPAFCIVIIFVNVCVDSNYVIFVLCFLVVSSFSLQYCIMFANMFMAVLLCIS